MAGLYIHIPFCTQKCIYCDFLSGTNLSLREQFIDALIAEMDCYLDFFNEDKIRTIYFGGGTPSLLSVDELKRIYDAIAERWDVSEVEEFTMECNPDDLSEEYLEALILSPCLRGTSEAEGVNNTSPQILEISAKQSINTTQLTQLLYESAQMPDLSAGDIIISNLRHYEALTHALESIDRVIDGLQMNIPADFVAQDIREALFHLAEITGGEITTDEVLGNIFAHFCIGK